jgi:hypothetical protein
VTRNLYCACHRGILLSLHNTDTCYLGELVTMDIPVFNGLKLNVGVVVDFDQQRALYNVLWTICDGKC